MDLYQVGVALPVFESQIVLVLLPADVPLVAAGAAMTLAVSPSVVLDVIPCLG